MHSFISSFNISFPKSYWVQVWGLAGAGFFSFIFFFEIIMRLYGWTPSVADSEQLWSINRLRASQFGDRAMIFVGASRIQLGIDTSIIKKTTGFEPVQLAIDGSPFLPVLENLSNDTTITGVIILSLHESVMPIDSVETKSYQWVNYYVKKGSNSIEPYKRIHNYVKDFFDDHMVSRLDGAKPLTVINHFLFYPNSKGNYLTTNTDRSRDADYSKVEMPNFYAERVQRHFGVSFIKNGMTFDDFQKTATGIVHNTTPSNKAAFVAHLEKMMLLINRIEQRGGRVYIIRFPTDKLIWEIDKKRYPRELFWSEIEKRHSRTIHFSDYKGLSSFNLPDGSHLDFKDKRAFTVRLMEVVMKNESNYL